MGHNVVQCVVHDVVISCGKLLCGSQCCAVYGGDLQNTVGTLRDGLWSDQYHL